MPQPKTLKTSRYPLPAYNFRVRVDGATLSFAQISGINVAYETLSYRHGLSFWEGESITKYALDKYIPITLRRGTVPGIESWYLYGWIGEGPDVKRTVEVSLCDEEGEPVVSWRIAKAIAVKLEAPTFDASTNEVSIETLELMGAGIAVQPHYENLI